MSQYFWLKLLQRLWPATLNINMDKKSSQNEQPSGYTSRPYLGKPRPLKFALGIDGSLDPELSCQYCKDTSHLKENCIKLNRRLAYESKQPDQLPKKIGKLRPPLVMDQPQRRECEWSSQLWGKMLDNTIKKHCYFGWDKNGNHAMCHCKNAPRCALVPTEFKYHLYWIPAVRSHCSQQSYFDQHILPKIKLATGEKADAHCLFKLTVANDGQMPIKMYTKLDLTFLGLKVLKVGVLIAEEPNQVLDKSIKPDYLV